jgi:hypothetical protein
MFHCAFVHHYMGSQEVGLKRLRMMSFGCLVFGTFTLVVGTCKHLQRGNYGLLCPRFNIG